jgi:hydrogenase nickel incorporation protein HypA/HybF
MHELSIMRHLFTIIEQVADEHHLKRVNAVRLKVGKLQQIIPDMFTFAFTVVAEGTRADGAELHVDYVPIKMRCEGCGHEFTVDDQVYICPACGATRLTMLQGAEIILESLDGEPDTPKRL